MLNARTPLLRFLLPTIVFTFAAGCAQYHHLVPPPPPTTSEGWKSSLTLSLALLPGDRFFLSLQTGVFVGANVGRGEVGALGLGFNGMALPTSVSFVLYDSLSQNLYATYALHLSQLYARGIEGGYTPSIEADAGLFVQSGDIRQSVRLGLAFMPDISNSYLSWWNVFSGSPRAAVIPIFGYDLFAGPVVVGAAWYPGMTRYLLKSFREPQNSGDTLLFFRRDQVDSQVAPSAIEFRPESVVFALKSGEMLRLMKSRDPFPQLFSKPVREVWARNEFDREDPLHADRYWWVIVDTVLGNRRETETRYERIMALDTGAIMERYRRTGELEIRDDPERLHWLDDVSIPFSRDLILSMGVWLPQ